jgi:hypothetical protein
MAISRTRRSVSTSIIVGDRKPGKVVSTGTLIRSMYQANINGQTQTALSYEFPFGISTFTHDGAGVLYTEIPRPLNLPLVDATSQKLERCSFEFLLAIPYDSLNASVDSHIVLLQDFATDARPVNFLNVHSALALKTWNIDSMSFQVTRVNRNGQATAVTCNISLVEYLARTNERFVTLPKFTYTIPKGTGLAGGTGSGSGVASVTGNVATIEGEVGGKVKITTATNHGLKKGDKVKIQMTANLPDDIKNLHKVEFVYEISEVSPTTFKYNNPTSGLRVPYPVISPKVITYSTTDKAINSPFVLESKSVVVPGSAGYSFPSTKGRVDTDTTTASTPLNTLLEAAAKRYLYGLQERNSTRFRSYLGKTDSERYKKAVAYLVKISQPGKSIKTISLDELIKNTE